MPLPLIKILNEHKKRQKREKRFTDDFRVCGGVQCLRDTSISNKNIQFAQAAGLPVIRVHDFRHTHASLLVNEGINIQEIARRLGHAQIEMTWNTYSHLYPREAVSYTHLDVYKRQPLSSDSTGICTEAEYHLSDIFPKGRIWLSCTPKWRFHRLQSDQHWQGGKDIFHAGEWHFIAGLSCPPAHRIVLPHTPQGLFPAAWPHYLLSQ